MVQHIVYLCAILLIPIVPAYILYKLLPNETKVSGPFKGLNIQLTGSFGGFFLLVLLSSGLVAYFQKTEALEREKELENAKARSIEYHYNLHFPENNFPTDMGKASVSVKLKKQGSNNFGIHKDYSIKDTSNGILVSVNNIDPNDIIYMTVSYGDKIWESESSTVPVGHLEMTAGHKRDLFR